MSESQVEIPQPPIPPLPTLPPSPPEPTARVSVAYQTPLSSLPGVGNGGEARGRSGVYDTPGLNGRDRTGAHFLAELSNDPERTGWRLDVLRIGPAMWEGVALAQGVVEHRLQPMPYLDVYDRVKQIHGGGDYRIQVIDDMGRTQRQIPFKIETITDPPKPLLAPNVSTGHRNLINPAGRPGVTTYNPNGTLSEEEDLLKLKLEERKTAAEMSLEDKQHEQEMKRRRRQEEAEAAVERKERRTLEPVMEVRQQVQTLERTLLQMQQAQERQMQQFMTTLQTTLLQTAQKPVDNSHTMLMIESMKSQQAMMTTLMTAVMNASTSKQHEAIEQWKIKADQDRHFMEMMFKLSQGNGKSDKLLDTLVNVALNKQENSVEQAIKLLDMGRQQTMELLEMRHDGEEQPLDFDPDLGFMGNVGKAIFALLRGLMKGGNPAALAAIMGALGKQDPAQVNNADLQRLALVMEQNGQGAQMLAAQTQQPPVAQQGQRPNVTSVAESPIEDEFEETAEPTVPKDPEQALRFFVTEAMRAALDDFAAGRREQEWVDMALGKWNKEFLDVLASAPDIAARVELIKGKCEPLVFEQLYASLLDEKRVDNYRNFIRAVSELVNEHTRENGLTPARVVAAVA